MIEKETIREIIETAVLEKEAFVVDIRVSSTNKINVEIDSFTGFSINDCVEITRLIESNLDRDEEDYELEVASAGLSEPFKVVQQYQKNLEKDVEVLTSDGKKIAGVLLNVSDKGFEIEESKMVRLEGKKKKQSVKEKHTFAFDQVKSTKIIIKFK